MPHVHSLVGTPEIILSVVLELLLVPDTHAYLSNVVGKVSEHDNSAPTLELFTMETFRSEKNEDVSVVIVNNIVGENHVIVLELRTPLDG